MINKKDIIETITLLKITYPSALKDLGEQELALMIEVWTKDFEKVSKDVFNKAINNIRNKNKFFPSIADIKEEIAKMQVSNIPEAEDEWQNVLKAVGTFGSYRQQEALESLKPYTAKIVCYVGFNRICMATPEEQIWNKKEFIAEYNSLKDKEIINLQIGEKERLMLGE